MNRDDRPSRRTEQSGKQVRQRCGKELAAALAELGRFLLVPHGREARGLVDNHDCIVGIDDLNSLAALRRKTR